MPKFVIIRDNIYLILSFYTHNTCGNAIFNNNACNNFHLQSYQVNISNLSIESIGK